MSLPVVFYCLFTCLFYVRQIRKIFYRNKYSYALSELIPITAALIINIVYFVIEIFIDNPDNPFLFYISTSIIQLINVLFILSYQKKLSDQYMHPKQQLLSSIISYIYVIMAVLTLYACVFVNIYITVIILLITSFILTLSLSILLVARRNHKNYMKHNKNDI